MRISNQTKVLKELFDKDDWLSTRELSTRTGLYGGLINGATFHLKLRGFIEKENRMIETKGKKHRLSFYRIKPISKKRALELFSLQGLSDSPKISNDNLEGDVNEF